MLLRLGSAPFKAKDDYLAFELLTKLLWLNSEDCLIDNEFLNY